MRAERWVVVWGCLTLALAVAGACGDDGSSGVPDGGGSDAGADGGRDATTDAGADAGGDDAAVDGGGSDAGDGGQAVVLSRPSRSTTVDVSEDDAVVAMVNPAAGSVSVFDTTDDSLLSVSSTGAGASAVVIHPNSDTMFVANQADATVVRLDGIRSDAPSVSAPVDVGSEPTGLAISPSGAKLFVAEWAEGRVSVIDTTTMEISGSIAVRSPYAVAVTNDGDADDDDELVVIPEFFGEATEEISNTGRTGHVRIHSAGDLSASGTPIQLDPVDSGFGDNPPEDTDMAAPNQLYGVTIHDGRIYVPTISVSPTSPVAFNRNVHPVLYVASLEDRAQDDGPLGTANLARFVRDFDPQPDPRWFLADIVAVDFASSTDFAYVVSRGADVLQRIDYSGTELSLGSTMNAQIDLGATPSGSSRACQNPTGVVTAHGMPRAYLNCWVSRNLGVVDLASQSLVATTESTALPTGSEAEARQRGLRFFHTGRGRWSSEAWSACSSCHPGGLTDNVTWVFPAGPRQTTSLDGSYSKGPGSQKQRVFNWTGIFDEIHDFERNTRGVSGGLGAVTEAEDGSSCLNGEIRVDLSGAAPVGSPIKELQDAGCTDDWDDVEAWVRTIRPPSGRKTLDPDAVARGRALFEEGNCVQCHGGAGWTVSRRFWTPSTDNNAALASEPFSAPDAWPDSWNAHTTQIQAQTAGLDPDDTVTEALAPPHVACVIRSIGTFGMPGDLTETSRVEVRQAASPDEGARAQGAGGYNVPSLYGLNLGAPYLHHGLATDLEALLTDDAWQEHLLAGNAVFSLSDGTRLDDLVSFLLSIDADTEEMAVPSGFDGCPTSFP